MAGTGIKDKDGKKIKVGSIIEYEGLLYRVEISGYDAVGIENPFNKIPLFRNAGDIQWGVAPQSIKIRSESERT